MIWGVLLLLLKLRSASLRGLGLGIGGPVGSILGELAQATRRRQLTVMSDRTDEAFLQRIGKGWRMLRGLQARRMHSGSGTLLVHRPTKATNHMATAIAIIANKLNEDSEAVMTSSHNNIDTRCLCALDWLK